MGDKSKIEWCDATWNPVVGCSPVSAGCAHCYAARQAKRLQAMGAEAYAVVVDEHGKWTGLVNLAPYDTVNAPLAWKRPRRIFVNSMSDLFHENVNTYDLDTIFMIMAMAEHHRFMVLTKRPSRMREYLLERRRRYGWPSRRNVCLGVSCEDQAAVDARVPVLLDTPAAMRAVSVEPMLGPVTLVDVGFLDWVICGGESGRAARGIRPEWVRGLRDQCVGAGVPFFFKQWGDRPDSACFLESDGMKNAQFTAKKKGNLLDGEAWEQFPEGWKA